MISLAINSRKLADTAAALKAGIPAAKRADSVLVLTVDVTGATVILARPNDERHGGRVYGYAAPILSKTLALPYHAGDIPEPGDTLLPGALALDLFTQVHAIGTAYDAATRRAYVRRMRALHINPAPAACDPNAGEELTLTLDPDTGTLTLSTSRGQWILHNQAPHVTGANAYYGRPLHATRGYVETRGDYARRPGPCDTRVLDFLIDDCPELCPVTAARFQRDAAAAIAAEVATQDAAARHEASNADSRAALTAALRELWAAELDALPTLTAARDDARATLAALLPGTPAGLVYPPTHRGAYTAAPLANAHAAALFARESFTLPKVRQGRAYAAYDAAYNRLAAWDREWTRALDALTLDTLPPAIQRLATTEPGDDFDALHGGTMRPGYASYATARDTWHAQFTPASPAPAALDTLPADCHAWATAARDAFDTATSDALKDARACFATTPRYRSGTHHSAVYVNGQRRYYTGVAA